jgi:hypothetical protein
MDGSNMKLMVKDVVGENAITLDDGQNVFDRIKPELAAGRVVELDFTGVAVFASPFLNAAVGQLLKDLKPDALNRLLSVTNLAPTGGEVLARVIENAKRYYSSPDYREAQAKVLGDMAKDS